MKIDMNALIVVTWQFYLILFPSLLYEPRPIYYFKYVYIHVFTTYILV